jgi:hypothetical protein
MKRLFKGERRWEPTKGGPQSAEEDAKCDSGHLSLCAV